MALKKHSTHLRVFWRSRFTNMETFSQELESSKTSEKMKGSFTQQTFLWEMGWQTTRTFSYLNQYVILIFSSFIYHSLFLSLSFFLSSSSSSSSSFFFFSLSLHRIFQVILHQHLIKHHQQQHHQQHQQHQQQQQQRQRHAESHTPAGREVRRGLVPSWGHCDAMRCGFARRRPSRELQSVSARTRKLCRIRQIVRHSVTARRRRRIHNTKRIALLV